MANDRIWLLCPYCEEKKLLYKYYPNRQGFLWEPEELDDFITKHLDECHKATWDLRGIPGLVMFSDSGVDDTKSQIFAALQKAIKEFKKDTTE